MIHEFTQDLVNNLYGNPHSASSPSARSSAQIELVRLKVLGFLNASPADFDIIFVQNATAAIKLVMECFRDLASSSENLGGSFSYMYHKDAHTSLVGVREHTHGRHRCFHSDAEVETWLNGADAYQNLHADDAKLSLFAYPGQSNMTGRRLPLHWYVARLYFLRFSLVLTL